jgi:chemotaxis protein methyltransferase CheR
VTRSADHPQSVLERDAIQPLAPAEFEQIRQLAHRAFGLDLRSGKEELVSARLRRLVRNGGFQSFRQYYRHVLGDATGKALAAMVDALATNHTSFLREPDHFEFLREQVAPRLAGRESVEVWSAACATGEEAWTLAFVLNDALPNRRVRILATDISNRALESARSAIYAAEKCHILPATWMSRYFVRESGSPPAFRVAPAVREQACFRRLNLIEPYGWTQRFPVIFCRNVMIYFDRQTQESVVKRLSEHLEPGGYLFVGHAESLAGMTHLLEHVRPAVYRKPRERDSR